MPTPVDAAAAAAMAAGVAFVDEGMLPHGSSGCCMELMVREGLSGVCVTEGEEPTAEGNVCRPHPPLLWAEEEEDMRPVVASTTPVPPRE